jgi:hypothetical protein
VGKGKSKRGVEPRGVRPAPGGGALVSAPGVAAVDARERPEGRSEASPPDGPTLAANWGGVGVRRALLGLGAAFALAVVLGAAGSRLPRALLPSGINYFTQIAKLFPSAAQAVIDYRAEGWACAEGAFVEIDVRPHFPIHADDKESRFARALFFHRTDRPVMQALKTYIVTRHNTRVLAGEGAQDTPPATAAIAGVRFSSVRWPIPPPGAPVEPLARTPLASLLDLRPCPRQFSPEHAPCVAHFYFTRPSVRAERCAKGGA